MPPLALLRGKVAIRFLGEPAVDAGGVFRDFIHALSAFLDRECGDLLVAGPDGGLLPAPLPSGARYNSAQLEAHQEERFGIGRLVALAMCAGR